MFISYTREDFIVANRVVAALREHGPSVWWDDSLTAGAAWDAELEREIAAAATVVVLWTPRSVNSEWVRTEAHYGQERGKLIPVMIEACTIPLAFMLRQTVNLCDWRGETDHRQWRQLLAWIAGLAAPKPAGASAPVGRLGRHLEETAGARSGQHRREPFGACHECVLRGCPGVCQPHLVGDGRKLPVALGERVGVRLPRRFGRPVLVWRAGCGTSPVTRRRWTAARHRGPWLHARGARRRMERRRVDAAIGGTNAGDTVGPHECD